MQGSEQRFRGVPYAYPFPCSNPNNNVQDASVILNSRQDPCGILNYIGNPFSARIPTVRNSHEGFRNTYNNNRRPSHQQKSAGIPQSDRGAEPMEERRHWIFNQTLPPKNTETFIVVSYNILGVANANEHWRELYGHIPPFIMHWNYRKGRILLEIKLWSPDILCLQEVDRFDDLQDPLVQRGYEGVYKGRTGGSPDGCATFWRSQKFCLLQEESIEFQDYGMRHNVAQLCVLQIKPREWKKGRNKKSMSTDKKGSSSTGRRIVVCNIHVLFNPNRGDIKLGQVRNLLERASSLSEEWGGIPVIVAGDFNSVPQSPLYQFIRDSVLDVSNLDRRGISGQVEAPRGIQGTQVSRWTSTIQGENNEELQLINKETTTVSMQWRPYVWTPEELKTATGNATNSLVKHPLNLQSAYSSIQGPLEMRDLCNEPVVTTYHGRFMGTVDYIWYSEGLQSTKVLDILPIHVLQRTRGLPSKKWGSDHLALACEFAFTTNKKQDSVLDNGDDSARSDTVN